MYNKQIKRGFTLVELLIVIGILAILATVVLLILNPAQLLAQARDSQRVSDIGTLNSALSLYLATASTTTTDLDSSYDCASDCFVYAENSMAAYCNGRYTSARATTAIALRTVDGTGWVPVNLGLTSGGSPLAVLPLDPTNDGTYFYSYACDNTNKTYELGAKMESTRYSQNGSDDVESTDGGNKSAVYEVGNDPALDL